ncbi:SDR family NAD(P)-dependent oxidoreductase [Mesorhizobium australicum]|uniref:NAD(P)-dependent dehydrogenase, short-chain alcohol dehydrogenase family n=1 Tax=Mesorhizobium australicum TaxID=536018 RepID=A0A1X7N0L5_9HYPH|nr:SDR family NAD(P)-dependent oxidoreductase [Mesorhizobium australicum]SMH30812.1 NAD(P)-dependent dehydrogenase, short-chain alcohol dehydrogenase family [Mesorhizobium australicum]
MTNDVLSLEGKIAVVTGAASGIGRAGATALAAAGARVAILDWDRAGIASLADEISAAGGDALALECDVSSEAAVRATAGEVASRLGPCDVLVNNAAIIRAGSLDELTLADWNLLLSINLTGYFLCAQAFGRQMHARGRGSIVNVGSVAAKHATPFAGAYSVAKAGVQMLSRQIAVEWGEQGIRSNCVSPGLILTSLSESMYARPGIREAREQMIPSRRIGKPEDIAKAVLFLASDLSDYVNGEELTVDGGFVRNLLRLVPRAGYEKDTS